MKETDLKRLADDLYAVLFERLDQEEHLTGLEAGEAATDGANAAVEVVRQILDGARPIVRV